jgi:hypothetical protein
MGKSRRCGIRDGRRRKLSLHQRAARRDLRELATRHPLARAQVLASPRDRSVRAVQERGAPRQGSRARRHRRSLYRYRRRERPREPSQAMWIINADPYGRRACPERACAFVRRPTPDLPLCLTQLIGSRIRACGLRVPPHVIAYRRIASVMSSRTSAYDLRSPRPREDAHVPTASSTSARTNRAKSWRSWPSKRTITRCW